MLSGSDQSSDECSSTVGLVQMEATRANARLEIRGKRMRLLREDLWVSIGNNTRRRLMVKCRTYCAIVSVAIIGFGKNLDKELNSKN